MPEHSRIYFQRPGSGARCSTARSARLRQWRFQMGYEDRDMPPAYSHLAEETRRVFLACEEVDMPAPYLSLRLHKDAPERYWHAAASYVIGGLGFPVVNDADGLCCRAGGWSDQPRGRGPFSSSPLSLDVAVYRRLYRAGARRLRGRRATT